MFVCEARSWDYCFMLVSYPFLSVTFLKLYIIYTQSVVCVLYLVHVLYSACGF